MKPVQPLSWLAKWFTGEGKAKQLQLIQEQRKILRNGLVTSAEVIDADLLSGIAGSLIQVKLLLKMRKDADSFTYIHTTSFLPLRLLPGKGQVIKIKYTPGNLAAVVIL